MGGVLTLGFFGAIERAHAWGQYGHEQGNDAAVTVLGESNGLGRCFGENRYLIRRMAVTPDIEWKNDMMAVTPEMKAKKEAENEALVAAGKKPKPISKMVLSKEDYSKRLDDDKYEHPMHFDEVDAWAPNPASGDIAKLPAGDYKTVFPFYKKKLKDNASYVTEIDPSKTLKDPSNPSVNEVTDHGTAPWRAQQMFRLGVDALKKKDVKAAFLYLGTMGHYVCDMSQPFHASLNYDGHHNDSPAAGIHHEIDTASISIASRSPTRSSSPRSSR
ncbi:MAG: hypothetical protein HY075_13995 [Deltaproteobacteria bacterium]|nr:hypothetical protein [Deltaproteobacteria bacterium]